MFTDGAFPSSVCRDATVAGGDVQTIALLKKKVEDDRAGSRGLSKANNLAADRVGVEESLEHELGSVY